MCLVKIKFKGYKKIDGGLFLSSFLKMNKRKNRSHHEFVKRRCVEDDRPVWVAFAFMYLILAATLTLWAYITISIFKAV
jgi:hypothetical protein